jgi:hypothetical protein
MARHPMFLKNPRLTPEKIRALIASALTLIAGLYGQVMLALQSGSGGLLTDVGPVQPESAVAAKKLDAHLDAASPALEAPVNAAPAPGS